MSPRSTRLWGRSARRAAAISLVLLIFGTDRAFAHGALHDQIKAVSAEIAVHPRDARLYLKRAELHRLHGELTAALSDYDRAARLEPPLAEVELGRGKALLEAGRPADARAALERFLRKRPDHGDAHLTLARTLVRLRLPVAADAEYARIIALVPRARPDVYFERANALANAGRVDAAVRALDEGIARLGPLVALEDLAIELERRRKNYDGALVRLDRISSAASRRETWLARRGEILAEAGRAGEARASFLAARDSIESLPPRLRRTRAIERLETRVRASLERLERNDLRKETADAKS